MFIAVLISVIASEAKQSLTTGLLRHFVPRNDTLKIESRNSVSVRDNVIIWTCLINVGKELGSQITYRQALVLPGIIPLNAALIASQGFLYQPDCPRAVNPVSYNPQQDFMVNTVKIFPDIRL